MSGSLEEQIHQSKIREERLEAALKDAKERLLAQEAIGENLKEIGDWLEFVRMNDPPGGLKFLYLLRPKFFFILAQVRYCLLRHGLKTLLIQAGHKLIVHI